MRPNESRHNLLLMAPIWIPAAVLSKGNVTWDILGNLWGGGKPSLSKNLPEGIVIIFGKLVRPLSGGWVGGRAS